MNNAEIMIRKISSDDWGEYKKLRLQSQQTDPQAFGGSYEDEISMSDDAWKEKIKELLDYGETLFAREDEKAVGMVRITFERKEKFKHIAHLMAFYVNPDYRGKDIGKTLLQEALKEIQLHPEIIKIKLCVNPEQKAAMKLYERFGFKITGKSEKEMRIADRFYDQYYMEKFLY